MRMQTLTKRRYLSQKIDSILFEWIRDKFQRKMKTDPDWWIEYLEELKQHGLDDQLELEHLLFTERNVEFVDR